MYTVVMMVAMEQEKGLKEEIIAAVRGEFLAFKIEVKNELKGFEAKNDIQFRGQGVLLEKMQGDIDTLVEGQEILAMRVDRLDGRMERVEDQLDRIDVKIDVLGSDMKEKVDKKELQSLERRVCK